MGYVIWWPAERKHTASDAFATRKSTLIASNKTHEADRTALSRSQKMISSTPTTEMRPPRLHERITEAMVELECDVDTRCQRSRQATYCACCPSVLPECPICKLHYVIKICRPGLSRAKLVKLAKPFMVKISPDCRLHTWFSDSRVSKQCDFALNKVFTTLLEANRSCLAEEPFRESERLCIAFFSLRSERAQR